MSEPKTTFGANDQEELYILPTSFGQERFWALDQLNPGNPTWSVPVRFRLRGALNVALLERAFNEIVRRHEVLRTTFAVQGGTPVQVVQPALKLEVPVTDLRNLPKVERDAEVDRLSFNEARWRFDLAAGPLFRVSLLRIADDEHLMLVNSHHTVVDYWSVGIISAELAGLYEAYSLGKPSPLPELPIQYADYSIWQREQAEGPGLAKELNYWKQQLKDLPQLEFPTDHPRCASPTYDATITSQLLPTSLTDPIRDLAKREGTTLFNAMLAALAVVLHQYTGQTDIGIATQVAGRTSVETEALIGLFINTVILRADISGNPSFVQLLGRIREVGIQSLDNNGLRFEQLLREIRPEGYPSHHSLFRVNFICQRDPVKPQEFAGVELTVIPSKSQGALYDLHVFLIMRNEGWRLACEYNTDLFEATTITGILNDYRRLLEAIVADPNSPISVLPLSENATNLRHNAKLPEPGENPSKYRGTDAAATESYAMPASVAQRRFWVLEDFAPGNPALHMRACVRLTGPLSVELLEKSLQFLVDRHEILRTTLERSSEEIIQLVAPSGKLPLSLTSLADVPEADREDRLWEGIRAEASAPFNMLRGPLARARLFRLKTQEHVLVVTTHHILTDGWSQNVIQRDLWTAYEAFSRGDIPNLPQLEIQYADFVHWQTEWLASAKAAEQMDYWRKQLSPPLSVLNFPTDQPSKSRTGANSPMETLLLPEELTRSLKSLSQSHDATMFMVMLAGYAALLNRYTGQEDIVIGAPVANRRSETEALIGPFAGPVSIRLNLAGNPTLGELVNRVRDVSLEALSHADLPFEVLLEKLTVRSAGGRNPLSQCYFFYQVAFLQPRQLNGLTVTPMPDFGLGTSFELQMGLLERSEGVRAQLEYNPQLFEAATIQEVLKLYENVLEGFVADSDQHLSELPLPVRRSKETLEAERSPHAKRTLPHDDTEKKLTKIWEEVLQMRRIGLRDNYFDLGGHSLLAVRLFAEIENVFGKSLPLSTLIAAPTIEQLACVLRNDAKNISWSPLVEIQPGGSGSPFFCVHGGGGNVLIYRDLARHLGTDQPVYGLQSQGLDGEQPLLMAVEEMAELYVKEIQRVQPRGPYFLGGYCMGGTVALEIAQQLRAQGEAVALLALFDTVNWSRLKPSRVWDKTLYQLQRIVFHAQNFLLLGFKDKLNFFRGKLDTLRSRTAVWRGYFMGKIRTQENGVKSESILLARIWETNDQAGLDYVPRFYPGVITDFRPVKQYARYHPVGLGWDNLVESHRIVTLPVYPAGMLIEPFVKDLARALKASIEKAARQDETVRAESQVMDADALLTFAAAAVHDDRPGELTHSGSFPHKREASY